jgi:hypothetical protein
MHSDHTAMTWFLEHHLCKYGVPFQGKVGFKVGGL